MSLPWYSRMAISQSASMYVEKVVSPKRSKTEKLRGQKRGGVRTAVDGRDSHQDTRSTSQRATQVGSNAQQTEDGTSERGGGGDDALELLVHGPLAVAGHDHLLVLELLGHVSRTRAGDLDPRLGEEGALEVPREERWEKVNLRRC